VKPITSVNAHTRQAELEGGKVGLEGHAQVARCEAALKNRQVVLNVKSGVSSYWLKLQKLTIKINASGITKNNRNTAPNGAAWTHAGTDLPHQKRRAATCAKPVALPRCGGNWWRGARLVETASWSGGYKLIPLLDHVGVFVHHCVPAGDPTHACLVAAPVAHTTRLGQQVPVGALDVLGGCLAFHPIGPLVAPPSWTWRCPAPRCSSPAG